MLVHSSCDVAERYVWLSALVGRFGAIHQQTTHVLAGWS